MPAKKTKKAVRARNLAHKKTFKNKYILLVPVLLFAVVGVKLLFFASAAPNNCSYDICDVNQGRSGGAGVDSVLSTGSLVQTRASNSGWEDQGVAFRAPNKPKDGAKPVYEFYRADITATGYALEGSSLYNKLMASNNDTSQPTKSRSIRKGIAFYAWPTAGVKDTVPIYNVCRDGWYLMNSYTSSKYIYDYYSKLGDYWRGCGIVFYAYDEDYYYTPPATQAPGRKDTDCATANIKPGDKGNCVKWLKSVMKTDYKVDTIVVNDTFDVTLNNAVRFFLTLVKRDRPSLPTYSNIVTKVHWDTLINGRPDPNQPDPNPGSPTPTPRPTPKPPTPAPTPPEPGTPKPELATKVTCVGDGRTGPRVQLVYLRAEGVADRYAAGKKLFQASAVRIDGRVNESAQKTGGTRKVRWVHDKNCEPTVLNLTIPASKDTTTENSLLYLLEPKSRGGLGLNNDNRTLLIYHDTKQVYCGLGGYVGPGYERSIFDTADPSKNPYNKHGGVAIFSPQQGCWGPMVAQGEKNPGDVQLHELWHAMGAVNESAASKSYGKHCNDDQDVMCYDDRKFSSQPFTLNHTVCPNPRDNFLLDCNNDDYFNTNPKAGSYLTKKWNTANSRFLIR